MDLFSRTLSQARRTLLVKVSRFLIQSELENCTSLKSFDSVIDIVNDNKHLFIRYISACIPTFNSKKQYCQNLDIWIIGYETVYATRRKDHNIDLEKLRLRQQRDAGKNYINKMHMDTEIFHRGVWHLSI